MRHKVLFVSSAGLAVLVGLAAFNAGAIREYYEARRIGYRFHWMPEGVAPAELGSPCLNDAGQVAVSVVRNEFLGAQIGRWSFAGERLEVLDREPAPSSFRLAGVIQSQPRRGFLAVPVR